jgi:hypothetical protein
VNDGTRRARLPGAIPACGDRVANFRPRGADEAAWRVIQPFVLGCVRQLPCVGWSSTTRTLRVLSRLATWALGEGMALDAELLLDPDTVERFVTQGLTGDPSRATYRSVLRRIGPLLTKSAPWEPRPLPTARRQVAPPYTRSEIETLIADAGRQSTDVRTRASRALLALGAGAGLDGRWVTRVKVEDVAVTKAGVLVHVGEPASRVVPVLAHWEAEIVELASTAGDQFLVGGYSFSRNRASTLTSSLEAPPGHPRLSAARLRSTWLLWHLTSGTRLRELAAAAGLQGVTVLSDLLPAVPPVAEVEARSMLRGAVR